MKNDETMFKVRIACYTLDSKPRIKWYIGKHGAFDDCKTMGNGKVWLSKVVEMNKDELHWVLGAVKEKMIKTKTYSNFIGEQRFIVIEAEVLGCSQVVRASAIAVDAVRDPLLIKCGMTKCSECPVKGNCFTDLKHDCVLPRVNYAIRD